MSSRRAILYALAGIAGLAFGTGDPAGAAQKKPVHFGVRSTSHTPAHHAAINFRGSHVANPHQRTVTHQRFHKVAVPSQGTPHTHFGHLHGPSHPSNPGQQHVVFQGKFKPGPGHVSPTVKKLTIPIIKIGNNKIVPVWKGPKKIWVGGHWKVFVPFTALAAVLVGGSYYWPDAYLTVGRPYCEGVTPDGCRLNWQMVNFADGGNAYQCVQYCPRPNAPPPAQAAALVPAPPPPPNGACEVTIYSEPNLAGQDSTTGDEQPALSQSGWQNAIASIQVKSGVWDFFTDENFAGENMRLRPGTYQNLGPEWTRKINSFMCAMTALPQQAGAPPTDVK